MQKPENIEKAIQKGKTKLIFTETTSNPTLLITDIAAASAIAKKHNILHVCDSTFSSPYLMQPFDFGADIVLHSTTKYFDGHNVTVGGALVVKTQEHYDMLSLQRNILGNIMTPYVAFHLLQTIKTLPLRMEKQSKTAMSIAKALSKHPKVLYVSYPGLPSHSQHDVAKKQYNHNLFGGMVSFEVSGGTEAGNNLRYQFI